MKKLMIAACAVMLGISAQAVSANWSFLSLPQAPDSTKYVYTAYLIDASAVSISEMNGYLSKNDLTHLGTLTGTTAQQGTAIRLASTQVGSFTTGTEYSLYTVILDDTKSHYYITEAKTAKAGDAELGMAFANLSTGDYKSANGWQAVPEPTSGLLLLLGVAGLALKRKRA